LKKLPDRGFGVFLKQSSIKFFSVKAGVRTAPIEMHLRTVQHNMAEWPFYCSAAVLAEPGLFYA
jgi:hypothetical protein